jgi:hypothetical protein
VVAPGTDMGVFSDASLDPEGSTFGYVQLECDSPMVEELRRSFGRAAGCDFGVTQRW